MATICKDKVNSIISKFDNPEFVVTGTDVYEKRFSHVYGNINHAACVNLYRGTVWVQCKDTGRRKRLWEVYN